MFKDVPTYIIVLVTGNSVIRNGELVMGGGAALQAKQLWPGMPGVAAQEITHLGYYGVLIAGMNEKSKRGIGLFQTKYHWKNKTPLSLIERACYTLDHMLLQYPDYTFRVNYPGIGLGGCKMHNVEPILKRHFDNNPKVEFWTF